MTTVVPTLARTTIFGPCSQDFLSSLAAPLAEVEARSGAPMGKIRPGAVFGEVAVLGVFMTRVTTVRALTPCKVLAIPCWALKRAIDLDSSGESKALFDQLKAARGEQVARNIPLNVLPLSTMTEGDLCARAIALQAAFISLSPGQVLWPLAETDPCGPHFMVFVEGKAVLEMERAPESERTPGRSKVAAERVGVLPLQPGSLLLEGVAAEFSTYVRAITPCEVYRVKMMDLQVAVASMHSPVDWLPRFQMLCGESHVETRQRGNSALGLVEGLAPHPDGPDIIDYRTRRLKAIGQAHLGEGGGWRLKPPSLALDYAEAAAEAKANSKLARHLS